jgi:TRAP-type uncharacterized transport system substrate-binding protein
MRGLRAWAAGTAIVVATLLLLVATLEFLAPELSYGIRDRAAEVLSGNADRRFRIALGSTTGSSYRVGTVLNQYLKAQHGYELEVVTNASPGNADAVLDPLKGTDFSIINSATAGVVGAEGVYGIAALEPQYFFAIVPNESSAQEFRDVFGAVNAGARDAGDPPTLGERVLESYGMSTAAADAPPRVSIVRPSGAGNLADFEAGLMVAATRTQDLHSDLVANILANGAYRLLPIRDNVALATFLPGTKPGVIPAGLYGPNLRIPPEPVPTLTVNQVLVARSDVPARVVRDILEIIYNPRFARDVRYEITEEAGRKIEGLPLHPAAEFYYGRNELLTSDRLERLSLVAALITALFAGGQFVIRYRHYDRARRRRLLLGTKVDALQALRRQLEAEADPRAAERLMREADDVLGAAEREAVDELLDAPSIESLRSVHRLCASTFERRLTRAEHVGAPQPAPPEAVTLPLV